MEPEARSAFAELYQTEYTAIARAAFLVVGDEEVAREIAEADGSAFVGQPRELVAELTRQASVHAAMFGTSN